MEEAINPDTADLALYRAGYERSADKRTVSPIPGADVRAADRALGRLHSRTHRRVYATVHRRLPGTDPQIIEGAFLDALYRRSFDYDSTGGATFATWLSSVVGNAVSNALRDAARAEARAERDALREEKERGGDDDEMRDLIRATLDALDDADALTRDLAARILAPALGGRPEPRRAIEQRHGLTPKALRVAETRVRERLAAGAKAVSLGFNR
ncbi:hypothetical protein G3N30_03905 [Microbacterium lacticum]|uniref:hypothetical protein n=1 Tax=Microbacterium lacticum TaxID=33885 RepID=UPI0018B0370D|nr:hypothetical protein [Microbacterium lacticum]MBF9335409.1 hypothetical protein [Microbacterium lacticum]